MWILTAIFIGIIAALCVIAWETFKYYSCPGHTRCNMGICTRDGIHGCPVSPNGDFLTEAERKELKKKIDELD